MSTIANDLDRIDLKILPALQQDGRISNLKLAEHDTLASTAVLARVQRLTREGYILGAGVRETRTYAVMEEVKNTTNLPLS